MNENNIENTRLIINNYRAALIAEKEKFGSFIDKRGRRYSISDLYMQISDYEGTITYKKWFEENFPDDIGGLSLSLHWSIAYYELGKMTETKIYTIDTAFKNIYLHKLLLNTEVDRIDMHQHGIDMLEYAQLMLENYREIARKSYLNWLSTFVETDEYKEPINKFIALNKLLKDEKDLNKRSDLLDEISALEAMNKKQE